MGVDDFWDGLLGSFKSEAPFVDASELKGKRFAVDISIWFNKYLRSTIDQLATTSTPPCPAPDLLRNIMAVHRSLSEHITLVYVYDGKAPPHKEVTKQKRAKRREDTAPEWFNLSNRVNNQPNLSVDAATLKEATESRTKLSHPTSYDHANILRWMKDEGNECIGSIAEADQQMVQLERDGVVDGIITEDSDINIIALGAKRVLCKMSRKNNGQYQFKVFDREKFFSPENPFNAKLSRHPHLMTDIVLLLGNDYCPRIAGNGAVAVFEGSLGKIPKNLTEQEKIKFLASRERNNDSILDRLAEIDKELERFEWLRKHGTKGVGPMPTDHAELYWNARRYMLHAPVLQYHNGSVSIVPLNPFPSDCHDWSSIGMSHINELANNEDMIKKIYHCDVVPIEQKPIEYYQIKLNSPIFSELDFDVVPIPIQPTLCIVNWLRARGLDVSVTESREQLESLTENCLRVQKPIIDCPLEPIAGLHDAYRQITSRHAGNAYDTPNNDYFSIVAKLKPVTDDDIDEYLGDMRMCRTSIRVRVKLLFEGGHYDPKTIKCRNVEAKIDGTPCIMISCKCMSSKSSVMHSIAAIFEDTEEGKYRVEESNCSCKKGEHFCSHLIGFLHMIACMQQAMNLDPPHSQEQFEQFYRVNPKCVQSGLMLIENTVLFDKFQRELTQGMRRKRQRMS